MRMVNGVESSGSCVGVSFGLNVSDGYPQPALAFRLRSSDSTSLASIVAVPLMYLIVWV